MHPPYLGLLRPAAFRGRANASGLHRLGRAPGPIFAWILRPCGAWPSRFRPHAAGSRRCAMRRSMPLGRWDRAIAAFLTSQRALGRAYMAEEYALSQVRKFLAQADADDL